MDRKAFNKITKEVFLEYGFVKKNQKYFLILQDVSLVVYFASWRGVKSFNYYFSINELYDETFPFEQRGDTLVEIKMEYEPSAQGYHKHEIIFEQYTENEYRELLVNLLHSYFDVYKENAIKFLKDNAYCMALTLKAKKLTGIILIP